jgi:hypothetical protein
LANAFGGSVSKRSFGGKRFLVDHGYNVDFVCGLALLFGIGTRPFHEGIRRRGGIIFTAAFPSERDMRILILNVAFDPKGNDAFALLTSIELARIWSPYSLADDFD